MGAVGTQSRVTSAPQKSLRTTDYSSQNSCVFALQRSYYSPGELIAETGSVNAFMPRTLFMALKKLSEDTNCESLLRGELFINYRTFSTIVRERSSTHQSSLCGGYWWQCGRPNQRRCLGASVRETRFFIRTHSWHKGTTAHDGQSWITAIKADELGFLTSTRPNLFQQASERWHQF